MSNSFYGAFEDRHRGSRALIKSRLAAYLPFIRPLAALYAQGRAIDLGCGRGEWLELLGESGFAASGVDLDEGMLAVCRQQGLDARHADALKALQDLPDASMALISAFHLVEHLPFAQVRSLVGEALRVLQPGGLLILETPNPENLVVGSSSFYMDPSHERPIPAELLDFVAEQAGFLRHKVVRLQESAALDSSAPINLHRVLYGVSPDYSVVAQKDAAQETLARFVAPFRADYGISLGMLAGRYDLQAEQRHADIHQAVVQAEALAARQVEQTENRIALILHRLDQAEAHSAQVEVGANQAKASAAQAEVGANQAKAIAAQAEVGASQAKAIAAQAEARASQAQTIAVQAELRSMEAVARSSQAEASALQAEVRATQLAAQLDAVFRSHSWRITAPLRIVVTTFQRAWAAFREDRLISGIKRRSKSWLRRLGQAVLGWPRLKGWALKGLNLVPSIKFRLKNIVLDPAPAPTPESPEVRYSSRAARILAEIKQAIAERKP